ncbi:hypothetical protein MPPM_5158 [Methylorubrum populi]|uniref:Uncharacterized protein n=1 Tax=Methylorubrum populi TaxID=223967 RepID=A0A160PLZ1_9HYPH|nr:hypothetical protein [Methylorubrum populi]BAU93763.1 hypothetical protein MPPM_5158 [Methylorubrum populi]
MPTKTIALAAALTLAVSGGALAQSNTGKGGTGGTTDSASPMRNNTGNSMRPTTGTGATAGSTGTMAPGATTGSTTGATGNAPGGTMGGGAGSAGGGNSAAGR